MSKIDELREEMENELEVLGVKEGDRTWFLERLEAFMRAVARQETETHFKKIQKRGQRAVNAKRNYGNKGKVRQDIG